jgi:aspartyl-tRNA synthetase
VIYPRHRDKIIDKFKIESKPIHQIVSNKRIDEMIMEKASGLTQKDIYSLSAKVKKRVHENPSMTEKEISSKILQIKTEYRKQPVGNQD